MRRGFALLFLSLAPLFAQNAAQFAGMQQDLADLRNEVEKLKLENADLRDALTKSKAGQAPAANQAETVAKLRAEILAEVDRRLKQQGVDVNAALAEQARQVNAALAGKPAAPVATFLLLQRIDACIQLQRGGCAKGMPCTDSKGTNGDVVRLPATLCQSISGLFLKLM